MQVHNLVAPLVSHYDKHGPLAKFVAIFDQCPDARVHLLPHDCKVTTAQQVVLSAFKAYESRMSAASALVTALGVKAVSAIEQCSRVNFHFTRLIDDLYIGAKCSCTRCYRAVLHRERLG